jgi:hypothetical protein
LDDDQKGEHRVTCGDVENPLDDEQVRGG